MDFCAQVLGAAIGSVFSLVVAVAVFFLTRHFTKKDAAKDFKAALKADKEARQEERRQEGLQELRAGLSRMAAYTEGLWDKEREELLAEAADKVIESLYMQHVYWTEADLVVAQDLRTVLSKWLSLRKEGKLEITFNNELVDFLRVTTKFLSAAVKNEEGIKPVKPEWWVKTDAVSGG